MDSLTLQQHMDTIMKVVYSIIVLIAAKIAVIFAKPSIRRLDGHIGEVDIPESTHKLIENVLRYCIYAVAVAVILYIFGMKDALYALLTGSAVMGFAIGYAAQDIVSNMLSGVMIAVDRPFKVKDRILAAGITGTVEDIALRTTEIKTDDGVIVLIPNSSLLKSPIHNYSRKKKK